MSKIPSYLIGRHSLCDLVLEHPSVSRWHAEVIFLPDGRRYLTDRASSGGTFVWRDGQWQSVRQDFVARDELIRFGEYEIPTVRLDALLNEKSPSRQGGAGLPAHGSIVGTGKIERSATFDSEQALKRNRDTGEIIQKDG